MYIPDLYKPIKNFGYFLITIGVCGFLILFTKLNDVKYIVVVWVFIGSVSFFHLFLGIGVMIRKRWIFGLFKSYLKLLYFGFPIGTYISRETLSYINKNNIERYLK